MRASNMPAAAQRIRWKSYWSEAARAMKRAALGGATLSLAGVPYHVAYEARKQREQVDLRFLKLLAGDCRCVFDIGANVGLTALVMSASLAETGKVYAFEPSEASCLIIREHALLNGAAGRIEVINALVAEKSGLTIDFHWDLVSLQSSMLMPPPSGMSIPLSKVCVAIDDFTANTGAAPDLIKIDVEGAEGRVLAGMPRVLRQVRPTVFVELHSWPGTTVAENASQILKQADEAGYRMIRLSSKEVVSDPASTFADFRQTFSSVEGRCRVLLLPGERELPDWLVAFDTSRL